MKRMTVYKYLGLIVFAGIYVACSPVKFSADTSGGGGDGVKPACTGTQADGNLCKYNYSVTANGGKVDILIVNDNSASMSFEQKALAQRFAGFIDQLDAKLVDYRIAMTTTDIHENGDNNEPRAINGNGAFQNGGLIDFGGTRFLTPQISDRVARFNSKVVRQETLQCEQFIANWVSQNGISGTNSTSYSEQYKINCPSGDERGIYAASLVVNNNPESFIRADANLAIIFLSDEDVRSGLYSQSGTGYPLNDLDQPATLINNIESKYGKKSSTSVHSIVVKDSACLTQQNSQALGSPPVAATTGLVSGSTGNAYLTFYNQGWGKAVDICFNDYTSQLGEISSNILNKINNTILNCANPQQLQVTFNPANSNLSYTVVGKEVRYNMALPVGTQVQLQYACPLLM